MRSWLGITVLAMFLLTQWAGGQTSAPSKASRSGQPAAPASPQSGASSAIAHASPSPTPAPPKPNPALSQAPIANGPKYSPTQLDFGAIDYGASSKRTFSLTPPVSGNITLEFPAGSFVAAELRRIPPPNLGQAPGHLALVPPMKPAPQSNIGQTEVYKWSFAAGEEMQLDILFAPSFSKDKNPGLRAATMKFSGPGTITPWTVAIAMRGTVLGLQGNLAPGPAGPVPPGQQFARMKPAGKPDAQSTRALAAVLQRKAMPKARNPRAAPGNLNASVMAALTEQQTAALAIRSARSTPMSTRSGPGNVATAQSAIAPSPQSRGGKSQPQPSGLTADGTNQQALGIFICDQPKIRWVDKRYNTIFTPVIKQSNGNIQVPQHVIEGCMFGKQQGSAYLAGNFRKGQLPLTVNYWSDTEIDVALDPTIEGELDENNVTLIVKLADGTYLKGNNYRFYATRGDPVPLFVYPDYSLSLESTLIAPTSVVTPLDGNQPGVFVGRLKRGFEGNGANNPGNVRRFDRFYFTKLTQGFAPVDADATYWYISQPNGCIAPLGLDPKGGPYDNIDLWSPNMDIIDLKWLDDCLEVDWTPQHCGWKAYASNSLAYQVTVYVVGPKGVKAWADGKQ
jgi:hypothetical protein